MQCHDSEVPDWRRKYLGQHHKESSRCLNYLARVMFVISRVWPSQRKLAMLAQAYILTLKIICEIYASYREVFTKFDQASNW